MSENENKLPELVTMGHPRLARPSEPVPQGEITGEAFQERLRVLNACMVEYLGIGIAAPQIGWWERFFMLVVMADRGDGEMEPRVEVWINPEITHASQSHNWAWEGCLSVPGLRGWIRRPDAVSVRGLNQHGQEVSREFTGWEARVFQHEFDHLDGMLFPYRALDPRHIITLEEMEHRDEWPSDWPAPGARDTPLGRVVPE